MSVVDGHPILAATLEAAVPLHIKEVRDLPYWARHQIAAEAGQVIASSADGMMYGSKTGFGGGARELRQHQAHGNAKAAECESCPKAEGSAACCMRRFHDKCGVCLRGDPSWSAGEVFNFLARGLAVAACQPGGVTFAGLHWCAYPHPRCPAARGARPPCCTCAGNETDDCVFCSNGCAAASGKPCCRTPKPLPATDGEPPPSDWRPDEEYGDLIEDVTVTGDVL